MTRNAKIASFIVGLLALIATNFLNINLDPSVQVALSSVITLLMGIILPSPGTTKPEAE